MQYDHYKISGERGSCFLLNQETSEERAWSVRAYVILSMNRRDAVCENRYPSRASRVCRRSEHCVLTKYTMKMKPLENPLWGQGGNAASNRRRKWWSEWSQGWKNWLQTILHLKLLARNLYATRFKSMPCFFDTSNTTVSSRWEGFVLRKVFKFSIVRQCMKFDCIVYRDN